MDDEPARMTGRKEVRPAAELGPIIVCLDTSGSMMGAREVVAKAVVLECMRGAHTQDRKCFVYAFRCACAPWPLHSLAAALTDRCAPWPLRSLAAARTCRCAH